MKYTMINEYYPPSNEAVVLLGQSNGRWYTHLGTFKADDHPSPAFYIVSGARIALSENYITHWLQLPPLPGDESEVEDDV
jgi:hypothetical protein